MGDPYRHAAAAWRRRIAAGRHRPRRFSEITRRRLLERAGLSNASGRVLFGRTGFYRCAAALLLDAGAFRLSPWRADECVVLGLVVWRGAWLRHFGQIRDAVLRRERRGRGHRKPGYPK